MYGGHRSSEPAVKPDPGEEDLFFGAIEEASLLRMLNDTSESVIASICFLNLLFVCDFTRNRGSLCCCEVRHAESAE